MYVLMLLPKPQHLFRTFPNLFKDLGPGPELASFGDYL